METIKNKMIQTNNVFDTGFMCGKSLFVHYFNELPSAAYAGNIDGEKAFNAIREKFSHLITDVHSYRYYGSKERKCDFNETFMVLKNNCVIEFDTEYCEIYHNGSQDEFVNNCLSMIRICKARQRRKPWK